MPVLDASFLIDLEHNVKSAHAALRRLGSKELVVPGQAALELMSGRNEPIGILQALRRGYRVLLARDETLIAAARIRAALVGKGKRPTWGDIYIAAETQVQGTYVVTADARDFEAMGCSVWDYRNHAEPPS